GGQDHRGLTPLPLKVQVVVSRFASLLRPGRSVAGDRRRDVSANRRYLTQGQENYANDHVWLTGASGGQESLHVPVERAIGPQASGGTSSAPHWFGGCQVV